MFIRGLKAKIAINIAVLLFLAMLLIDLITIVTVKRELIRAEIFRANVLLASVEYGLLTGRLPAEPRRNQSPGAILAKMVGDPQLGGAVILDSRGEQIFLHRHPDVSSDKLRQLTRASMSSGKKSIQFTGTIRGFIWK